MKLKKLDYSFYKDHIHLEEALDKYGKNWDRAKTRGYGIVVIKLNNLTFAIPLRTNIKHGASYITEKNVDPNSAIKGKGLDFSKALLITDSKYISKDVFKIPKAEHRKLMNKEVYVTKKFSKYVGHYIKAVESSDKRVLSKIEYRYSTLKNYHTDLGIIEPIEEAARVNP